jgi:PAS domain S-box-containing protein
VNNEIQEPVLATAENPQTEKVARGAPTDRLGFVVRYGGTVLIVGVAAALRWLLHDFFGTGVAFITFFPTVALVAMFAGGGPGVLATALSAAIVKLFIGFGTDSIGEALAISLFILSGLIVSTMAEMLARARRRQVIALEEQVAERTRDLHQANARLRTEANERQQALATLQLSESRLTDETAALRRLNDASSRLWHQKHLSEGLAEMLDATIELLGADKGNVRILDAERGVLRIAAQRGFEQNFLDFFREVSIQDDSAFSQSIRSGKRIVIEDVEADEAYAPLRSLARAAGFRAVQMTPLNGQDGTPPGLLSTHFRSPHRPSQQNLRRLDLYARQAAAFIERCWINESLSASRERLLLFIEHAPAALAMLDRQMRYLLVSRRWKIDYRLGDEDLIGRSHYDVFPEIPERWKEVHRRALAGESVEADEDHFVRADGKEQWLQWEVRPWYAADGGVGGIVIFSEDVTNRKQAEEALRDREARLRAILETAADAIITINERGIIQSVNPATERTFGYAQAEMLDQTIGLLMPSPFREEHDSYLRHYLQTGQKRIIGIGREVLARRKDGSIFPADLAVSEIPHLQHFTGILRDVTRRKELEREVVEIASLEQRRIGQDLHDSVGQELTALNILAADLAEVLPTDPSGAAKLVGQITQGLRRSQQELRTVLRGLLPVAVDAEGLMAALADLADRIQLEGKAACTFDCPRPVVVTDNLVATHLYLIAQEAVRNALKHAKPRNVCISLESNHLLTLRVQDDGMGLPETMEASKPEGGLGLRIMRNRAVIIGATLKIEPALPAGTLVVCSLPRMKIAKEQNHQTSPDPDRR